MYKHILVPTDGSETADKAVVAGIDYAREVGAKVTLFTAVPEYRIPSQGEMMAHRALSLAAHERLFHERVPLSPEAVEEERERVGAKPTGVIVAPSGAS